MTNTQKSKFNIEVNKHQSLHYYQYNPTGSKNKLPLVLFLHGRGERGENLDLVETHGIPKLIKEGKSVQKKEIYNYCLKMKNEK